jgi:hypothetical protein
MRSRPDSSSPSLAAPANIFSPAFLAHLREQEEVLTAAEAEHAGPWKEEPVTGRPGAVAVLRAWESLDHGDRPEGIFWHAETARIFAALLPFIDREPLFHLADEEEAEGFRLESVYGEQGVQVAGWFRRCEPRLVEGLHLIESLVRSPVALAAGLGAAGPGAVEQVGQILAREWSV